MIIIFYHAHYYFDQETFIYEQIGNIMIYLTAGLGLLFFISGYLLYHNHPRMAGRPDIVNFIKKRVLRIYPLYWVALAISLVCFGYLGMYYYETNDLSPGNVLLNVLGLQFISGSNLSTYWFIGVIIVFYTLFPFIVGVSKKTWDLALICLVITAVMMGAYALINHIDDRVYQYFPIFAAGIVARRANIFAPGKIDKYVPILFALLFASIGIEASIFHSEPYVIHSINIADLASFFSYMANWSAYILSLCLLTFWAVRKYWPDDLSNKLWLPQISYGSYAAFLFDPIFFGAVYALLQFLGIGGYWQDAVFLFLAFPLAFLVGYVIQWTEDNLRKTVKQRILSGAADPLSI